MDPRAAKKRRSPKPKQKRLAPSHQTQSASPSLSPSLPQTEPRSTQEAGPELEPVADSETTMEVAPPGLPTPPPSIVTSPEEEILATLTENTIATTPVAPGTTVVDIHESFKVRIIADRNLLVVFHLVSLIFPDCYLEGCQSYNELQKSTVFAIKILTLEPSYSSILAHLGLCTWHYTSLPQNVVLHFYAFPLACQT